MIRELNVEHLFKVFRQSWFFRVKRISLRGGLNVGYRGAAEN